MLTMPRACAKPSWNCFSGTWQLAQAKLSWPLRLKKVFLPSSYAAVALGPSTLTFMIMPSATLHVAGASASPG